MRIAALLLLSSLAFQISCQFHGSSKVYDSFETGTLSRIWETGKHHIPGAVSIQSRIVRAGKSAVKIILRPGDQIKKEKGTILERAELTQTWRSWAYEDTLYAYSFSIFLPEDFPIVPNRLVIAQWKQRCPGDHCYPENPVLAVRYIAHELLVTHKVTAEEKILFRTNDEIRGKWLDFRFRLCFSKDHGIIKAWLNGQSIIDYKGPNAYPASGGYPKSNHFYFKTGLYRDRSPQTMTLYFDEFRMEKLSGE
jgi:hypothetical protein